MWSDEAREAARQAYWAAQDHPHDEIEAVLSALAPYVISRRKVRELASQWEVTAEGPGLDNYEYTVFLHCSEALRTLADEAPDA